MSRRFMPERAIASRTTGLTSSTSLRSRSLIAVSCANPMTATSLKISAPYVQRHRAREHLRSQRSPSRVGLVGVVVGVGFAGRLEPLDVAGVGLELLGPDRMHAQPHPHLFR